MNDNEAKQLLSDILIQAQEGQNIGFRFITSWQEFVYCWKLRRSTKLVIKTLTAAANNLFKDYCKDISSGTTDINKLLAHEQLLEVVTFYNKDMSVLKDMLDEYDKYLGQGHFWYSFLGGEREL